MPRYVIRYSKKGTARYIPNLDMMRVLERAMRRANLPVAFSRGFNPHPRISIAAPLPVGTEGLAEMAEMEMTRSVEEASLVERLNAVLPQGLNIREAYLVPDDAPALMAVLDRAVYMVYIDGEAARVELPAGAPGDFMALGRVEVKRRGKDGRAKIRDIRPGIVSIQVISQEDGLTMRLELKTGGSINVRPTEVVAALFEQAGLQVDSADIQVTRTGLFPSEKV